MTRDNSSLAGKKFGKLLVVEKVPTKEKNSKWKCICDCGKTIISARPAVIIANSCGCLRNDRVYIKSDPKKRFFEKVEKTNTCWIWKGQIVPSGYGAFYIHEKNTYAHRASWIIHFGDIPEGLFVCHKCDNPPCCNPEHLFLGTPKDNTHDMMKKGRKPEQDRKIPLSEHDKIICQRISGSTYKDLAQKYHVNHRTISRVLRKKLPVVGTKGENNCNAILTKEIVLEMKRIYKPRIFSYRKIAQKFGVDESTAVRAIRGITWKCLL